MARRRFDNGRPIVRSTRWTAGRAGVIANLRALASRQGRMLFGHVHQPAPDRLYGLIYVRLTVGIIQ